MRREYRVMVKNMTDAPITLTEMGDYEIDPDEELDTNDSSRTGQYWTTFRDTLRAIEKLPGTQIAQLVAANDLSYWVTMKLV